MANTKTIVTRIKNKVDTLAKWNAYTGVLLDGEIAVVRVPTGTSYTNPVTGKTEPVVELLMKVGDGTSDFASLPWMSAKASDVYDWAKAATVVFDTTDYKIKFKDVSGTVIAKATIDLSTIDSRLTVLESKDITVTPSDTAKPGVVQSVAKGDDDHEIDVTYGLVQTSDIADSAVTEDKIAADAVTTTKIKDANVTTEKLADDAVTNNKVASGIAADKITLDNKTLPAKIEELESAIASTQSKISVTPEADPDTGVVQSVTYNATSGVFTVSYGAVAAKDIAADAVETAKIKNAAVTTDKIADGNVTDAKIDTVSASKVIVTPKTGDMAADETLVDRLGTIDSEITGIKTNIAGGVHFRGTVEAMPETASIEVTVDGSKKTITAIAGDVVIWAAEGIEYLFNGSTWEELGDITRLGELETKVKNLKTTTTNEVTSTHKFVSQVTQSEGQIEVTYTQPTSADVTHDGSTVKAALESLAANKSDVGHGHKLTVSAADDDVIVLTGSNENAENTVKYTASHANSGVTAGIYRSVTVDAKGHVTSGTNPTTRDAYGLTDVYTKTEANAQFMTEAEVDSVVTPIKNNYIRYTQVGTTDKYQMHLGTGAEVIIFDCGGADND